MVELAWTDQLSVGNAAIDSEHKNLLNMVNDIVQTIRAGDNSTLSEAFKTLEDWLHVHFANETKIAQAINLPLTSHQQAQQYSLKELQLLKNELIAKDGSWSESAAEHYANFLQNWIIDEHIVKLDMPMKPALQKYPYNFLPA